MNLVEINSCNFGSTGNIMLGIAHAARGRGINTYICVPKSRNNLEKKITNQILIGNRIFRNLHIILGQLTGYQGCFSIISTWIFLKRISKIQPDIIHLHNLHESYINLPMLFRYIKKHDIHVVWTLHDCWAFTGQCPYFTMINCERWKNGCYNCMQYKRYPRARVDRTKRMWHLKRKWFTGVKHMTIVTPSEWLRNLVKESYLKEYPVKIIHNGIDLSVFKPETGNFRKKNGITNNQFVLLGVAFSWEKRKGLDIFIKLAKSLDSRFQIVLVGTDDSVDKLLPEGIISIHKTENQKELAEIYTAADLFVNPTREENYPTVNMEALACGTPVVTFNTGGSSEIIDDTCGIAVERDNLNQLLCAINEISKRKDITRQNCIKRANTFDIKERYIDYLYLYTKV